jgi:hypothetical protein
MVSGCTLLAYRVATAFVSYCQDGRNRVKRLAKRRVQEWVTGCRDDDVG